MKKWKRNLLGGLLILVGFGVIMLPVFSQLSTKRQQKQMIAAIQKEIERSRAEASKGEDNQEEGNQTLEEAYQEVDFSEEEQKKELEYQPDTDVSEILKYQKVIGLLQIKKLKLLFAVVEGASRDNIRAAIGHMDQTADFGEEGNCVLAGHRGGVYGEFFKNIHKLEDGDEVLVTDQQGNEYIYRVYDQFVVDPDDFFVCDAIGDEKTLTLLSCEDQGTRRLIVRCRMD